MTPSNLSEDELVQVKSIAEAITQLGETPGWHHYRRAVEQVMKAHLPRSEAISDADHALEMASRITFINGLQRALDIVDHQREKLDDVNKQLSKLQKP